MRYLKFGGVLAAAAVALLIGTSREAAAARSASSAHGKAEFKAQARLRTATTPLINLQH